VLEKLNLQVEVSVQNFTGAVSEPGSRESRSSASWGRQTTCLPLASPEVWQSWFQTWLEVLQPSLSPLGAYELCLRLTNDGEIQALNAQYRQKNQATDVLAFVALEVDTPHFEEGSSEPVYLGDIVISIDTAIRQAKEYQHSLTQELAWLACHGLLHLLGWDHPDDESLTRMLNQQTILLRRIGFSQPP